MIPDGRASLAAGREGFWADPAEASGTTLRELDIHSAVSCLGAEEAVFRSQEEPNLCGRRRTLTAQE